MSTNHHFATTDEIFRLACSVAGIQPTARQASKWRAGFGLARQYHRRSSAAVTPGWNASAASTGHPDPRMRVPVTPAVVTPDPAVVTPACQHLGQLTVSQLRAACRAQGVKGYSRLRKTDLLSALLGETDSSDDRYRLACRLVEQAR